MFGTSRAGRPLVGASTERGKVRFIPTKIVHRHTMALFGPNEIKIVSKAGEFANLPN